MYVYIQLPLVHNNVPSHPKNLRAPIEHMTYRVFRYETQTKCSKVKALAGKTRIAVYLTAGLKAAPLRRTFERR
jgi:hypothetical protein